MASAFREEKVQQVLVEELKDLKAVLHRHLLHTGSAGLGAPPRVDVPRARGDVSIAVYYRVPALDGSQALEPDERRFFDSVRDERKEVKGLLWSNAVHHVGETAGLFPGNKMTSHLLHAYCMNVLNPAIRAAAA